MRYSLQRRCVNKFKVVPAMCSALVFGVCSSFTVFPSFGISAFSLQQNDDYFRGI